MFGGTHDDNAGAMVGPAMPTPADIDSTAPVGGPIDAPTAAPASVPTTGYDPAALAADPAGQPAPAGGTHPTATASDDLLDIKQQALQQLSPLVGHLDQSPEEKFRTTMMMIQASDNQDLIKDAYAAASEITDEKSRAQALLDIINEINYFTQHQQ